MDVGALEASFNDPHAPSALSDAERAALVATNALADAPPHVRGDYPEWLDASLRALGEERAEEGASLQRLRRSTFAPMR